MRVIPKVDSLRQITDLRRVTKITEIQLPQFQATSLNRIAETLVLQTIHQKMRNFGYSEKIIQGTRLAGVNIISKTRFKIFFRSEYFGDSGFDVAIARESGTKRHFIEPLSVGNPFVRSPTALNWEGNKFSKGHFVSGIIASHIIEDTLDQMAQPFLDEYQREKRNWLEQQYGELAEIAV